MRIHWKTLGAVWAIVLTAGFCAGAVPVTTGQQLIDEFKAGATALELQGGGGDFALPEPLYIGAGKSLTLKGTIDSTYLLPTDFVITQGTPPADDCFGNAVKNGNFELNGADWAETTNGPPVINNNSVEAYNSSSYYALFSRTATASTGVPVGATDFTYTTTQLDLTKFPLPGTITEQLVWNNASIPNKLSPFPITLTHGQAVSILPGNYTQTLDLYTGPVGPICVTFWLYIPKYQPLALDSLALVADGAIQLPMITPSLTPADISGAAASVGDYLGGYNWVKVDLSTLPAGTHTISLVAKLNSNYDDPTIFLIGAAAVRSNLVGGTVDPVSGGGTVVDPGSLSGSIITNPMPPYTLPPAVIPVGQALGTATNPYPYSVLRFGGVGKPRATFSAAMPVDSGAPGDAVQLIYDDGSTITPVGAPLTRPALDAVCRNFPLTLPAGPGKIGFKINIDATATPVPSVFVIDNLVATIVSPTLETLSPLYAPKANNILLPLTSPDFENGDGAWTVVPTPPAAVSLTDIISSGTYACAGRSAVFDPTTLLSKPVNLYVWARVVKASVGGDVVTVTVDDGTLQTTKTLLDNSNSESAGFVMLPPVDVTAHAGKIANITFKGETGTNTPTPAVFALGTAQLSNVDIPGPDPTAPQDFATVAFSYIDDAYLTAQSLAPAEYTWAGASPYVNPIRFGGIHQPTLKYTLHAVDEQAFDQLVLLFNGTAESTPLAKSTACVPPSIETLLPPGWLGQPPATFGFRSTITDNAPNPSTVFELDDLCITHLSDALNALSPVAFPPCDMALIPAQDFESGGAGWIAKTAYQTLGSIVGASATACHPGNVARLTAVPAPPVETVTLKQTGIEVPGEATELTFQFKAPTAGSAFDRFTYTLSDGTNVSTKTEQGGAASAYAPRTWTFDPLLQGTIATLTFTAELAEGSAPASFAIDNVCIASPLGTALITVDGGSLTMSDLEVAGGGTAPAITVKATSPELGSLTMRRCMVDGAAAGVQFSGVSTGTLASSIFHNNGVDIDNQSGVVSILQCTLRDGTPIKTDDFGLSQTWLAASLLSSGGVSGSGNGKSYGNWISGNANGPLTPDTAFPNIDPATVTPAFVDSPFIGKLDIAPLVQSGASYTALTTAPSSFPAISGYSPDFKGYGRDSGNLGIGADEQTPTSTVSDWGYSVTPGIIGAGQSAEITVFTASSDFTGMNLGLRMVPEMPVYSATPYVADNTILGNYIVLTLQVTGPKEAKATVSFTGPFSAAADGSMICTDGTMNFFLTVDDNLVGMPPTSTSPLTVDTMAPELDLTNNPPTVATSSDTARATEGPIPWPGRTQLVPMSGNSLAVGDVHWFLDASAAAAGVDMQIQASFMERMPRDIGGQTFLVTTSGFDAATVSDLPGSVSATTVSSSPSPTTMSALWDFAAVPFADMSFQPRGRDRAGNVAKVVLPGSESDLTTYMKVWCMLGTQAVFDAGSTTPGQQTSSPRFGWSVPSSTLTWNEAAPCYPVVGYQVWAVDPVTQAYVSLTGNDWTWVGVPTGGTIIRTIDGTTPVTALGKNLSEVLAVNARTPGQSKELYIAIRGGDEAGNVQPFNPAWLTAAATFGQGLTDNGVAYLMWVNRQSQGNVAVDTDLNLRLSHAKIGANPPVTVSPFGSMARVPLPTLAQAKGGVGVSVQVSMAARVPELMKTANPADKPVSIEWKLYEEGSLVAQGRVVPDDLNKPAVFMLPDILFSPPGIEVPIEDNTGTRTGTLTLDAPSVNPAANPLPPVPTAFLRTGPFGGTANRLGDEGKPPAEGGSSRQREVKYMFVAQTVAITGIPGGGGVMNYTPLADPTPASVEFSIYVREMLEKVREDQPIRIYERK